MSPAPPQPNSAQPDHAAHAVPESAEQMLPLVYDELRRLAAARIGHEPKGQTLQPTALVHEAYLRLIGDAAADSPLWSGRGHFFGAAALAMRRILIDRARHKRAEKRGSGAEHIDLDSVDVAVNANDETLLRIDEALEKLAKEDPSSAELVRLRFFVGLKNEETAEVLKISERTAKRYWTFARAWLYDELQRDGG